MSTLSEILSEIPVVLKNRYSEDGFWIPRANRILGELETKSSHSDMYVESPILLVNGVTQYPIPSNIRKLRTIRPVIAGEVSTRRFPFGVPDWRKTDGYIRFSTLPVYSEDTDYSGTVAYVGSNHSILSGIISTENTAADADVSRLLTLTHTASGSSEYRIIADSDITSTVDDTGAITGVTSQSIFQDSSLTGKSNDYYNNFVVTVTHSASGDSETRTVSDYVDSTGQITVSSDFSETLVIGDTIVLTCGTILPNGVFDTTPVVGDTFSITSNYFIAEGFKKFTRFTVVGDSSPLEDEWEKILVDGLRYEGEVQTDQESTMSAFWGDRYRKAIQEWVDYHGQPRGDQRRTRVDTSGISSL